MADKKEWYKLTKKQLFFLCFYYLAIIILSMILILSIFIKELELYSNICVATQSFIGAMAASALGASIFYLRKIYKSCINLDFAYPENDNDHIRALGVFWYFFLRPIYAVCFAVILVIFLKSGMSFMTDEAKLNDRFIYIVMVLAFFVGYSSGDLLDKLESKGRDLIGKLTIN